MYTVYIIQSTVSKRYYTGCSKNFERRLNEHNLGKVRSTKAYVPWKVVYKENFESREKAYRREQQIKSYKSGSAFQKLINTESWQSG